MICKRLINEIKKNWFNQIESDLLNELLLN